MNKTIKIALVMGTRPEVIKLAPIINVLKPFSHQIELLVISTGQHRQMLDSIFEVFQIKPDIDLNIMKPDQTLEHIVAECFLSLPVVLRRHQVDLMLVQGDTSTAFAAALIGFYHQIRIGHVEAGLRTSQKYNPFPEEMNRRLISPIADFHFTPTQTNKQSLLSEGIAAKTIFVTGNTVIDALMHVNQQPFVFSNSILQHLSHRKSRKILVTAHRRENFGSPLRRICQALLEITEQNETVEIVYPVHLNPNVRSAVFELLGGKDRIHLIEPCDYLEFVNVMKMADIILTDSGGIQEEAPALGKPVLVLRETTERPEAVTAGTVKLVGANTYAIIAETQRLLNDGAYYDRMAKAVNPYGDGMAAERIVGVIRHHFGFEAALPLEFTA